MNARRGSVVAGGAVAALAVLKRRRRNGTPPGPVELQRSLTIELPREDVYRRWREPETQAVVWGHVAEATEASEEGARWRARSPLGGTLEWETRVVDAREGEFVRWETSGDLRSEGVVEFRDAPGEYGTEITLRARVEPPAGQIGEVAARLLDDPPKLVLAKTLRRFKSLVEAGEVPSTEHNPSARQG